MESHFGTPIKQYPGQQQVDRAVVVSAPGKHFSGLTPAEQKQAYAATAVEYRERHSFERHQKAWGAAHTGPGMDSGTATPSTLERSRERRDILAKVSLLAQSAPSKLGH